MKKVILLIVVFLFVGLAELQAQSQPVDKKKNIAKIKKIVSSKPVLKPAEPSRSFYDPKKRTSIPYETTCFGNKIVRVHFFVTHLKFRGSPLRFTAKTRTWLKITSDGNGGLAWTPTFLFNPPTDMVNYNKLVKALKAEAVEVHSDEILVINSKLSPVAIEKAIIAAVKENAAYSFYENEIMACDERTMPVEYLTNPFGIQKKKNGKPKK